MPFREKWLFRIQHILDSVGRILEYTDGFTEQSLAADQKTLDAVVRNFQIIGEAARHIPDEVQAGHPEIAWSEMQKMRHVLVHN